MRANRAHRQPEAAWSERLVGFDLQAGRGGAAARAPALLLGGPSWIPSKDAVQHRHRLGSPDLRFPGGLTGLEEVKGR